MDKFVTMENMEALLPLIKQRFQNIENRLPIFIYKYFEPGVTDTNTGSVIRLNDKYMNQVISIEDDVVITSLAVKMNNEDITKQAYTGPFSAEIFGKVEGEEASYLRQGDSYSSGEITPDAGWGIKSVRVQMGDDDITSEALSGHEVSVADVMGDIAVEVETACEVVDEPFLSRITANGLTLANTRALLKGINGNTIVWNQMVLNEEKTITPRASYKSYSLGKTVPVNHKIYIVAKIKKSSDFETSNPTTASMNHLVLATEGGSTFGGDVTFVDVAKDNVYHVVKGVAVNANANNSVIAAQASGISAGTIMVKDVVVIDLTQMFGSGNEPTLAEFESLYPLGNYATDAGRLLYFKGETMRSTKTAARVWNQMVSNGQGTSGVGGWSGRNTGNLSFASDGSIEVNAKVNNSTNGIFTAVNFTKDHKYYINIPCKSYAKKVNIAVTKVGGWGGAFYPATNHDGSYKGIVNATVAGDKIVIYLLNVTADDIDTAKNVYQPIQVIDLTQMFGTGNEPSTAAEFEAIMEKLGNPTTEEEFSAANLLQDITIDPTTMQGYLNGEGEAVQIFPSGMRSAGSVSDTVEKVDGKWFAKVNVGSVEITPANVTWSQWGTNRVYFHTFTTINSADYCKATSSAANRVSDRMTIQASGSMAALAEGAKGYVAINGNLIYITTADYNDRANLATFSINYLLATPRTYLLTDEWQQTLNIAYQVETGGMEIILPENGSEPATSPAKIEIQYGTNE